MGSLPSGVVNMKKFLLILFIGMFLISFIGASVEHTASTDTICNNNICTKTLYSGIRNVYEDNTWKKVEDARSLKDKGFYISYLEDDKDFPIEVIDFNSTSITLNLKQPEDSKELNKDIPVRVWKYNEEKGMQYSEDVSSGLKEDASLIDKYKETYDNVISTTESFKDSKDEFEKTYDFGMDSVLEFGYSSTTITLQEADTENLEDTYIEQDVRGGSGSSDNTHATSIVYNYGETSFVTLSMLIKFDSSSFKDSNIINATWNSYLWNNQHDSDDSPSLKLYGYDNQSWSEDTMSYDVYSSGIIATEFISEKSFAYDYSGWIQIDITNWNNLTNGEDSVSFMGNGSADVGDAVWFYTKEYTTDITLRPYLNITYLLPSSNRWLWNFKRISDGFPAMMIRGDGHVNLTSIEAHGDITAQQFCNETDCYTVTNFLDGGWVSTATSDLDMAGYRLTDVGEIVMSGAIQGQNILPSQNMTYSLGNETNWFLEAYIGTINAINITTNNLNSTILNSQNITSTNLDSTNIDSDVVNITNNLTIGGTKITVVGETTYYKSVA